ncbi:MAG: DEAD/DEAH box helicase, partial [Candidatus Hydrothermarchaeales archaeon]
TDNLLAFMAVYNLLAFLAVYLKRSGIEFVDEVMDTVLCPDLKADLKLRDYQEDALSTWFRSGKRGVIVLPTGSGKTVIGIEAISLCNVSSLVVVPTLDLMDQWKQRLEGEFNVEVGSYGGGSHELQGITVSTYDTAYLRAEELGNQFALIIFDEVHHLPAPGYSNIAEMFASPYRLGLTATYEREDGLHKELPRLVGGKVFEMEVKELAGKHLANYDLELIRTELTPDEKREYDENYGEYLNYLRATRIKIKTPRDFQRFIMRTGTDPKARKALLARHRAKSIALNSFSKIHVLRDLLAKHSGSRMLIFTQHNELVHRISREFLIPSITHKTAKDERRENLDRFRDGRYGTLVTSKVLDEGVDVPEANIGVILSGSGSTREYRQRLGRLLRKKDGKRAILYEIVSRGTSEVGTSRRRHTPVAKKLRG